MRKLSCKHAAILLTACLALGTLHVSADDALDLLEGALRAAPVQEKVYLHMDNMCYFKGDTIWYKAYVVRADDLTYSDMSRILYVELVSPDGLVVERQQVVSTIDGYSCGNFELRDSIYSGYYELRAYTRYMLNFCVTEHPYNRDDRERFYARFMASDFFRLYGTVYSRVFPVYERPDQPGDYSSKYIVSRPKQRLDKEMKDSLRVKFFPEGGHLVRGTNSRIAFEITNEEGEHIDAEGTIGDTLHIATEHEGRGRFTVNIPKSGKLKAEFSYKGKKYHYQLPDIEPYGCTLQVNADSVGGASAQIQFSNIPSDSVKSYAAAVLCRGKLCDFRKLEPDYDGKVFVSYSPGLLPTGVCDLIIFTDRGLPLADRLFFVSGQLSVNQPTITVEGLKSEYKPLEQATLTFHAPVSSRHLSIAIRDGASDEPSYDTGNILTDLLLSSELKGFVAHPDYYFESRDDEHRQRLDLVMMVQGWRRYNVREMLSGIPLRYEPEQTFTVEGYVYPTPDMTDLTADDLAGWEEDTETIDINSMGDDISTADDTGLQYQVNFDNYTIDPQTGILSYKQLFDTPDYGLNHGLLKKEVTLRGELTKDGDVAEVELETTDNGHYLINVPPFYGDAVLFLMAYNTDKSEAALTKYMNRGWVDEKEFPDYYVKRDLFYPIFAKKYDFYQCHQPDEVDEEEDTELTVADSERLSAMDRVLTGVTVKARRRRGLRAIDYTKPAFVLDTYELYNLITDYGLSFGKFNIQRFPQDVVMLLFGNYNNSSNGVNVQASVDGYTFYRDFISEEELSNPYRSSARIEKDLWLKRQDKTAVYSDFELRNEEKDIERHNEGRDVQVQLRVIPNDGMRYTYRDRRIILHGFYAPDDFYHPDYSHSPLPADVSDHRRTLYWNPNAILDAEGKFTASFYNNNKLTRMRVSSVGLTKDGQPLFNEP